MLWGRGSSDVGAEALAESRALEAANRYALAWQRFLASEDPQSMDLRNYGET